MKYLLSLLLFFTPFAFTSEFGDSETDRLCYLVVEVNNPLAKQIKNRGCIKNDPVILSMDESSNAEEWLATWCRFDRQIVTTKRGNRDYVTCVLYGTEPRELRIFDGI